MNNQPLRQLLDSTLKDNANYQKEIERLNKESEQLRTALNSKESTIKEAREYIHKNCILSDEWTDLDFCNFIPTGKITYKQLTSKKVKGLLKILDKENNETNEVISVEELEKYEPKNMAELEYQEWFWEDNE